MKRPEPGQPLRTKAQLMDVVGEVGVLGIMPLVQARKPLAFGRFIGLMKGGAGMIWKVVHLDGSVAAYHRKELEWYQPVVEDSFSEFQKHCDCPECAEKRKVK